MAIILEPNLSPMMTVTSTRILDQKPSINIDEIFKIHTSGSVICRNLFCCDILPLLGIAIFLYHVHSVCKKSIECSRIISNVPQHNPAVCPEIFIKSLQLQLFLDHV